MAPGQPRNKDGEWTDGGASASPLRNSKMSLGTAATMLKGQGFDLGKPEPWKPGDKETTYNVIHRGTGTVHKKTASEIIKKVNS